MEIRFLFFKHQMESEILSKFTHHPAYFGIISYMYVGNKSKNTVNGTSSNYFNCNSGVRQGVNLSLFYFHFIKMTERNILLKKELVRDFV